MENLVRLPFPELNRTDIQSASLDEIPNALKPFINETAFKEEHRRRNSTEDEVITDEDVADMPDDDDEQPRVNSAHFDGKKTTVTISSEAGTELYQHWLDQAVSGLMAAVATKKLENVSDIQKAAHQTCAKDAKTVQAHAKCVVMLLDIELKYQRWNAKFGNAKRIGFASAKLSNVVKTKGKKVLSRYRKVRRRKTSQKLQSAGAFKQTQTVKRQRLPFKEVQKVTKYQITESPPPPQQKEYIPSDDGWIGSFRMRAKRSIEATMTKPKQMATYSLLEEKPISPLALLAKKLVQTMRTLKHKDKKYKSWQKVVAEIKEEGKKIKQKRKARKMLDKRFELFKRTLRDEGVDKSVMKRMDVLEEDDDEDEENETEKLMREAKVQEYTLTDEERMMQAPVKLIREGVSRYCSRYSQVPFVHSGCDLPPPHRG
ncbi:unnamed protein product [Heligmosomoides polygyrus]|uniref:Ribosome biogenesis protein NOP53 n=1 Tax=Heligmosomoides polygyrus TaxID=6339 RepID=A0A3P7X8W1_HELPZ|nr:unnamed protein product [Heligmosomoides polygyrus]